MKCDSTLSSTMILVRMYMAGRYPGSSPSLGHMLFFFFAFAFAFAFGSECNRQIYLNALFFGRESVASCA